MDEPFKYVRIEAAEVLLRPGVTVTREAFLADPSGLVWQDGVEPAWIVEAYRANEPFRENIHYALSRSVSKRGDFSLAAGWLQILGPALTPAEGVALYEAIREQSQRLTPEWRPAFEAAFAHCRGALPPVPQGELALCFAEDLFGAIVRARSPAEVRQVLQEMEAAGVALDNLPAVDAVSIEYRAAVWNVGPEGLDMIEVARRVGHPEVMAALQERAGR